MYIKNVHRVNLFNQEAWLKTQIDRNTELRRKTKNNSENL